MMGERGNIKLVPGELWDNMKKLDEEGTCDGPLQVTLRCISHTGAQLQSYRDEPRIPWKNGENILVFVQFKPVLHSLPKPVASENLIVLHDSF